MAALLANTIFKQFIPCVDSLDVCTQLQPSFAVDYDDHVVYIRLKLCGLFQVVYLYFPEENWRRNCE